MDIFDTNETVWPAWYAIQGTPYHRFMIMMPRKAAPDRDATVIGNISYQCNFRGPDESKEDESDSMENENEPTEDQRGLTEN